MRFISSWDSATALHGGADSSSVSGLLLDTHSQGRERGLRDCGTVELREARDHRSVKEEMEPWTERSRWWCAVGRITGAIDADG